MKRTRSARQIIGRPVKADLSLAWQGFRRSWISLACHSDRRRSLIPSPASRCVEYTHTEPRASRISPSEYFSPSSRPSELHDAASRLCAAFLPPRRFLPFLAIPFHPLLFFASLLPFVAFCSFGLARNGAFLYFPASHSFATFRELDPTGSQRS